MASDAAKAIQKEKEHRELMERIDKLEKSNKTLVQQASKLMGQFKELMETVNGFLTQAPEEPAEAESKPKKK